MKLQIAKGLEDFCECAGLALCGKDDAPLGMAGASESVICKRFIQNNRAKDRSKQVSEETDLVQLSEARFSSF